MTPDPLHDVEALASHARPSGSLCSGGRAGRHLARAAIGFALTLCVGLAAGFASFVSKLEEERPASGDRADGIVALTGGSERISDAVDLLADGRAQRLLISGVNRSTSPERLASTLPQHRDLFDCCIDMDYQARNTVGNAVETKRWAESRKVRSLIVVTSSYHMPRAMLELQRAMPEVDLRPHPVSPDKPAEFSAWRSLGNTKILATEYGKYLAAYVRAALYPQIQVDMTATGSLRHKTSGAALHRKKLSAN
ncbi:MAG: YdcF family protein [Beijerinckiaceae bacterium]|nr:YdcF family protein [Beijerinckiaceae bacterium]